MYWVRMQNTDMAKMYQKLVLGMARHFAKSEARKQLDVLERGKLVAAAGSDGVYRRARLERLGVQGEGPDAATRHGGGVHCGLWGEGDCPAL